MKKTKSKKKKNNFKPTKPLIIIVSVVILLFVLRLLYLKIIDMKNRAWQKDYGITDEANPEGLTYEEFNASLLPEHQQEPGMREYLNDCPWLKANVKDPYSMDIYITIPTKSGTGGCNRETGVSKISIIIQNHDFKKGVKEFKAWLKKNKLKLGKDVVVEDYYPWNYEKICNTPKFQIQSALEEFSCLSKLEINCLVNEDHEVTEEWIFKVKKVSSIDTCKQKISSSYDFDENEKVVFIQEE